MNNNDTMIEERGTATGLQENNEAVDVTVMDQEQQAQLQAALLNLVDLHVRKEYLSELEFADVKALSIQQESIKPGENFRLYRLVSLAYSDAKSIPNRIQYIFNSLSRDGYSAVLLINGKKDEVELYIGITDINTQNLAGEQRMLNSALSSAFPGAEYDLIKTRESKELFRELFPGNKQYPVAAVPGSQVELLNSEIPPYSLEELIAAMKYKPFTALILSQSMHHEQLVQMRRELEDLYTSIAPLQKQDVSMSQNENVNYGVNTSKAITKSFSRTVGTSDSHTVTFGKNSSTTYLPDRREEETRRSQKSLIGMGIAAVVAVLGATAGPGAAFGLQSLAAILPSLFYGKSIGDAINDIDKLSNNKEPEQQTNEGSSETEADTQTNQESQTEGDSESHTRGKSVSVGYGNTKSIQVSYINKSVVDLLTLIDEQIVELSAAERTGAFCTGAYFIAGDEETAVTAANVYRSIVNSHGKAISPLPVYKWSDPAKITTIYNYLTRGIHPLFTFDSSNQMIYPDVTVGQMIRIQDIPSYFCLPEKTLKGFSVEEHAVFPRDIVFRNNYVDKEQNDLCMIGKISYMGKSDEKNKVKISINELRKHLFVAGTTGSGKSNFCYHLIHTLTQRGKKVMVIEPAKGEYKQVFGGRDDFRVYGTNAAMTALLRINPFAFPAEITVDEHIEALMSIFSNAWPMYSAMPAVLKDALETIYREKGFDLEFQTRTGSEEFPSFSDLLEALPGVIKNSEYSKEVKGNYTGALVTRVKSLTNGIYSSIFCKNEIGDEKLFDNNVIIDISRIRSDETKALIMGILVTRLSEYRESSGKMNSPLRHITLLEEAHHLLKGHRSGGPEGVSMGTASVEMISNAIAEMRTYGEGFVIADQSPASLDKSVMRNTFTKVFFTLPEIEDRVAAAGSLGLDEQQQSELARISTGHAVVYHRAWAEPVLVNIEYFDEKNMTPYIHNPVDIREENLKLFGQSIAVLLYRRMESSGRTSTYSPDLIDGILDTDFYWLGDKERPMKEVLCEWETLLKEKIPSGEIARIYALLFDFKEQLKKKDKNTPMEKWVNEIKREIIDKTALSEDETEELIGLLMFNVRYDHVGLQQMYVDYKTYLSKNNEVAPE